MGGGIGVLRCCRLTRHERRERRDEQDRRERATPSPGARCHRPTLRRLSFPPRLYAVVALKACRPMKLFNRPRPEMNRQSKVDTEDSRELALHPVFSFYRRRRVLQPRRPVVSTVRRSARVDRITQVSEFPSHEPPPRRLAPVSARAPRSPRRAPANRHPIVPEPPRSGRDPLGGIHARDTRGTDPRAPTHSPTRSAVPSIDTHARLDRVPRVIADPPVCSPLATGRCDNHVRPGARRRPP